MKSVICLVAGCLLFLGSLSAQKKVETKYKIKNIDSIQNVYIIYAKRNDSLLKIISPKEDSAVYGARIAKGGSYALNLRSVLDGNASKRHIHGFKYGDVLIKIEGGNVVWDLFATDDLKGLSYCPSGSLKRKKKKS